MTLTIIFLVLCTILGIIQILLILLRPLKTNNSIIHEEINKLHYELTKIDPIVRTEFAINRDEVQKHSKETRLELSEILNTNAQKLRADTCIVQELISKGIDTQISKADNLIQQLHGHAKENRLELGGYLKSFEDKLSANIKDLNELQRLKFSAVIEQHEKLKNDTEAKLEKIRETVEYNIRTLQHENSKKLDEMRNTVDEKLHSTLDKRFNDSFKLISERLDLVHKGLGEMQNIAQSVGDLKRVMSNVKTRGILGEYQLENIIEDLLTNDQYEKNVKTKSGSGAIVEFAIRMPNHNSIEKTLWLPIDSKFPKDDYEALVDAYENCDLEKIETFRKNFKNSIIKCAKDIKEKYLDPPNTTEYGIMFLPFESLYAEVLRIPGLMTQLQLEYKVTITGPTTLSALLNSLQMGFRTLAVQKRSSEVWDILGVIKTEFGKFGEILDRTKKKLQEATNNIDNIGRRSKVMQKKLRTVEVLPSSQSPLIIDEIEKEHENYENEFIAPDQYQ